MALATLRRPTTSASITSLGRSTWSDPFPPVRTPPADTNVESRARARFDGQELSNPTPQRNVMRALLRALHGWVEGVAPPPNQYPRLSDHTLVPIAQVAFPALPGVADPRRIVGPARLIEGRLTPLPHLVAQVDRDGNDIASIHDPEVAVPLATTTGWNFRREQVGNPADIYQTLGAYIPFAVTRADREAKGDPRRSIEERYRGVDDYLQRIRAATMDLIRQRYLLAEDTEAIIERARKHWLFAVTPR
jgi:alpha/beta hydrolase family protein